MDLHSTTDVQLRAYLLGGLKEEEQARLEEEFLTSEELQELLSINESELIDDYLMGNLSAAELAAFQKCFLQNDARRQRVEIARLLLRKTREFQPVPEPSGHGFARWNPWRHRLLPVASVLLLIPLMIGVWQVFFSPSLSEKGIEALRSVLHESPFESRISGLALAPRKQQRGASEPLPDAIALRRVEGLLLESVEAEKGKKSSYALGQYYLSQRNFDLAIGLFEKVLETSPDDAAVNNDLGVAYMEKAVSAESAEQKDSRLKLLATSLEYLNRALQADQNRADTLFNRALCHERLEQDIEAESNWLEYLKRDSTSNWAAEARRRLELLRQKKQRSENQPDRFLDEFLAACRARDAETALQITRQYRDLLAGRYLLWQLSEEILKKTDEPGARQTEALQAFSYLGELEEKHLKDRLAADLARFYQSVTEDTRIALLQARDLMKQGKQALQMSQYAESARIFQAGRQRFSAAGNNIEAHLCDFLSAFSSMQAADFERAESVFTRVLESSRQHQYRWFEILTLNSLSILRENTDDLAQAVTYNKQAVALARESGDLYDLHKNLSQLAHLSRRLGDYDDALRYLDECLLQIRVYWPGTRQMWRNYGVLTQTLAQSGFPSAAIGYGKEELHLSSQMNHAGFASLLSLASLYSQQGNLEAAFRLAKQGLELAERIPSKSGVSKEVADARLRLGYLYQESGDIGQALEMYAQSIDAYQQLRYGAWLYEACKGKLFCHLSREENLVAYQEAKNVFALLEKYRKQISEEHSRNIFFDREQNVYDAAAELAYFRLNDEQAAFSYTEASRARSLLDRMRSGRNVAPDQRNQRSSTPPDQQRLLVELSQKLHESPAQIVEYIVLESRILVYVITQDGWKTEVLPVGQTEVEHLVSSFVKAVLRKDSEVKEKSAALYRKLFEPIRQHLSQDKLLCIVPDKALFSLPFQALYDSQAAKYLIQDYTMLVAPSAETFMACNEPARRERTEKNARLLIAGNPAFNRKEFAPLEYLPAAELEAQTIARLYQDAELLTGSQATRQAILSRIENASVIHFATHYLVNEIAPGRSKLLLAASGAEDEEGWLRADEVSGFALKKTRLVILSACQSGVEKFYRGEGMIGLARSFLGAGVPQVIASLWPVDSASTSRLMIQLHSRMQQENLSPQDALKKAQTELLSADETSHPYYWAGFSLIGGSQ